MSEKVRKKLVWDEHGVSEILADILILIMTVALFAVIFLFVWKRNSYRWRKVARRWNWPQHN